MWKAFRALASAIGLCVPTIASASMRLSVGAVMRGTRVLTLQPCDSHPEHGRRFSFAAFPLVDHGFTSRAHPSCQLLLTESEPVA